MAGVTFYKGKESRGGQAWVSRSWKAAITGEAGQATLRLDLKSDLVTSAKHMKPTGGTVVVIHGEGGCGDWRGVILDMEYEEYALVMTAYQPAKLLGNRFPRRATTVRNLTPGYCATTTLTESLEGVRGLQIDDDPWECGGPHIESFTLDGADAWGILSGLMDQSDHEIHVKDNGSVVWCGPLAYASLYSTLLVAGSSLRNASYKLTSANRLTEVMATSGNKRYVAQRGEMAVDGWSMQASMTSDSDGGVMVNQATTELERYALPQIMISGAVPSEHWAIRERQYIRVFFPQVIPRTLPGATYTCRVLGRSLADDSNLMELDLQVVQPLAGTALVAGAGGRQKPPQRVGQSIGTGSFAQQVRSLRRRVATLERGG